MPTNFIDKIFDKLREYWNYRIWKASDPTMVIEKISKYDDFKEVAFEDFLSQSDKQLLCAIICGPTDEISIANSLLPSESFYPMRYMSRILDDMADDAVIHIRKRCESFANVEEGRRIITGPDEKVSFAVNDMNVAVFHVNAWIEVGSEKLLEDIQNTICFGIILPYLYDLYERDREKISDYNGFKHSILSIANNFCRDMTSFDLSELYEHLGKVVGKFKEKKPKAWRFLISVPHESFDGIRNQRINVSGDKVNLIDRIVQYVNEGTRITRLTANCYYKGENLNIADIYNVDDCYDTELLKIYKQLLENEPNQNIIR